MPQERLGLFDTPPGRRDIRAGIAIVSLLFGCFLLILPVRDTRWDEVAAFIPVVDSIMLVGELIIAVLLYAQAAVFRSRALTVLATGYVFIAVLLVPHALTFPGAFAHDGLLGAGLSTTGWIAALRRIAFPIFVALYVLLDRKVPAEAVREQSMDVAPWLFGAIGLAAAATVLAIIGHDLLPPLFVNRTDVGPANLAIAGLSAIVPTVGAIALLLLKRRSVLDMWLLVALAGWLIQLLLNLPLRARFTAGWYSLHMMMLVSHLVVLLALIAESNRLYARLALSTAARNREREAQRMSMDAVAAAISHEVGQPLAAVSLNASAGLNWLARRQPDVEKAKESLQAISESGQRSFDILKSIRAMFAKEPGWATEFSLNDLIRETVSSLDKELAGAKVSLQLSLDEALPPVLGNRVQLQHVIRNLIVNSIESLAATRGRRRSLTIRSLPEDEKVLLQVSDNGIGIAAEDAWRIFEAFHTTKAAGSGIGLSLCRTIVEEHGGRIWASPGERYGATFHVQLPSGRAPAR